MEVEWRSQWVEVGKIEGDRCWDNLGSEEEDSYQIDLNHRRFEEEVEMVVAGSWVVDWDCRTVRFVAVGRRMGNSAEMRWEEDSLAGLEVEDHSQREVDLRSVDIRQVEDRNC